MKNSSSLLILCAALSFSAEAARGSKAKKASAPKGCVYAFHPEATKVEWTAFKTTEKVGVKGTFDRVTLKVLKNESSNWADLLQGSSFSMDLSTVNTGNPARDTTLKAAFFGKFAAPKIKGVVKSIGSVPSGRMKVDITMNEVTQEVPFDYTLNAEGLMEATGKIDLMNFHLQSQHESLHKACESLHKGTDGVSKTWTEVDLQVISPFKKKCQ